MAIINRYVVGTEWGEFALDPYDEGTVCTFATEEAARTEADSRNRFGWIPVAGLSGTSLIPAKPWNVYELVPVT